MVGECGDGYIRLVGLTSGEFCARERVTCGRVTRKAM